MGVARRASKQPIFREPITPSEEMDYLNLGLLVALAALLIYILRTQRKGSEGALPEWARIKIEELEQQRQTAEDRVEMARKAELDWVRTESELRAAAAAMSERAQRAEDALEQYSKSEEQRREAMKNEFKVLAGAIFEERSAVFKTTNADALGQLLQPFKEKLESFEREVKGAQAQEQKNAGALLNQLSQLQQLNTSLSKEAQALTRALKGENKTQGNWGEFVLERALELSGLQKGLNPFGVNHNQFDVFRCSFI